MHRDLGKTYHDKGLAKLSQSHASEVLGHGRYGSDSEDSDSNEDGNVVTDTTKARNLGKTYHQKGLDQLSTSYASKVLAYGRRSEDSNSIEDENARNLGKTYHPKGLDQLSTSYASKVLAYGRRSKDSNSIEDENELIELRESESSSYKELDKADEGALQRSFRAIQEPKLDFDDDIDILEDDTKNDNFDSARMAYNWEPSSDIQQEMMGISSPSKSKDWTHGTGIETTGFTGSDKIHLIPTATRESTPDSVGFSNHLTMGENSNRTGRKQVNAVNVQIKYNTTAQPKQIPGYSIREVARQMNDEVYYCLRQHLVKAM